MIHQLTVKFETLIGHLNAEENKLAREFLNELEETLDEHAEELEWLADLEAAGVDNWEGFDHAVELRRERKAGDQ